MSSFHKNAVEKNFEKMIDDKTDHLKNHFLEKSENKFNMVLQLSKMK